MKKFVAILFVCLLVVGMVGCGGDNQTTTGEGDGNAQMLNDNPRASRYDKDDDAAPAEGATTESAPAEGAAQ